LDTVGKVRLQLPCFLGAQQHYSRITEMQASQLHCLSTNVRKAPLRRRWLNILTKIKFWYYLWISIIDAIPKFQSMKNLDLLIFCSSRTTNIYCVQTSMGVNRAMGLICFQHFNRAPMSSPSHEIWFMYCHTGLPSAGCNLFSPLM
jgi:hypothetical protein